MTEQVHRRQRAPARASGSSARTRPHDIAIVNGPNGALHHFAFWLDDWDHVRKAADILAYNGVQIDQGPTRHGVTRGNTIYFFDPLGIRNEVFTGGYSPDPDFPVHHLDRGPVRPRPLLLRERRRAALPALPHLKEDSMSDRILRLQHVQIRVPDLELCTAYYTEVLGLIETAHEDDRVFLKCWDEHEHHSVVLRQAPTYGLDHMSFKVAELEDLDHYTERVEGAGIAVKRYAPRRARPGLGRRDPLRGAVRPHRRARLRHGEGRQHAAAVQPAAAAGQSGRHRSAAARPHLHHGRGRRGGDARSTREVLEFRLTEQIIANDGHQLATWMERSHTPHDLAIVTGPNGALHHFAFWLDDWNAVRDAADPLAYNGVTIDVAPTRHGVTRGYTVYFFDPVGNRNEVFTGGYWVDPDFEPITWTEEEMGRAMFYYAPRGQRALLHGALVTAPPTPTARPEFRRTDRTDAPPTSPATPPGASRSAADERRRRLGRPAVPAPVPRAPGGQDAAAPVPAGDARGGRRAVHQPVRRATRSHEIVPPPERRELDGYVTEIRIIRHGITQGYSTDAGLTPMGGWQAHQRGHARPKTLRQWPKMRIVCADTNRARQTAEQIHRGLLDGLDQFGRDGEIDGPDAIPELRNFQVWTPDGPRDITSAFRQYQALMEKLERMAVGDRPRWLVEIDRFYRTQLGGADPIQTVADHPADVLRVAAGLRTPVLDAASTG